MAGEASAELAVQFHVLLFGNQHLRQNGISARQRVKRELRPIPAQPSISSGRRWDHDRRAWGLAGTAGRLGAECCPPRCEPGCEDQDRDEHAGCGRVPRVEGGKGRR